jgi:hypothetical protein
MEKFTNNPPATFETVWAALQETDRILSEKQVETNRLLKETDLIVKENALHMKESRADYDRRMKKFDEMIGSWSNNHGRFAEEYFFNSFNNGKQNFVGERFDEIKKNLKGIETDDEFDIVMLNGHSIGIVEVKFKAHENDLPKVLKKVYSFRANFPKYQNHKVYLGLATMAFYPKLEEECIKQGVAIIKQLGDTVVINDAHLKPY